MKNKKKEKEIEILTVDEVADFLRLSKVTIYRLINSGELPAYKIGASWRISKSDLGRFINQHKNKKA